MFTFHSNESDVTSLLPIDINSHNREVKRETDIQLYLDEYSKSFKFKPLAFLRNAKNAESLFRQLTKTEEESIHAVFISVLAPFLYHQQNKEDNLNRLSDYIRSSFRLDLNIKFEEITAEQESRILDLVEFIWEILLEVFQFFNPLSTNWKKTFGKLVHFKDVTEVIAFIKPFCKKFHGIFNDSKMAVYAFIILTYYYCHNNKYIITKILVNPEEKDALVISSKDERQQQIQLLDYILKQNPFDYRIHAELAKEFLNINCKTYAKWAAYKAILVSPTFIDSYPVYIEARFNNTSKSTIIRRSLIKLSEEIDVFTGEKYKDFKFMEAWTQYINSSKAELKSSNELFEVDVAGLKLKLRSNLANTCSQKLIKSVISNNHSTANANIKANMNLKSYAKSGKFEKNASEENVYSDNNMKDFEETDNLLKSPEKKSKKKKSDIALYRKVTKEGSEALCQSSFLVAIQKYEVALNTVTTKGQTDLNLSTLDILNLKYCFAMSCIAKHTKEYIKKGMDCLIAIINDYPNISFPLAYYGQAVGLLGQNRFMEAKSPLNILVSSFEKNIQFPTIFYPGSDKVIEECRPIILKEIVNELLGKCRSPPLPVGFCCYESDSDDHYNEIYYSDPDFLGFARLTCSDRCHLYFHYECWNCYKECNKLRRKKDLEEMACITPDCKGKFLKIEIVGADGIVRKEICAEKEKSDREKMPPPQSALTKTKKDIASKDLIVISKRRRNNSEVSDDNSSVGSSSLHSPVNSDYSEVVPDFRLDGVPLCKKKIDMPEPIVLKKQKKLSSSKVIIIPEFTLTSNNYNEESVSDNMDDNTYTSEPTYQFNDDLNGNLDEFQFLSNTCDEELLKESVLSYLENFVFSKSTPVRIDDESLLDELNSFPVETQAFIVKFGGIENLLKKSKKLLLLDKYIVARQNENLDHLNLVISKKLKEFSRFSNGNNGSLYRTASYSSGLQSISDNQSTIKSQQMSSSSDNLAEIKKSDSCGHNLTSGVEKRSSNTSFENGGGLTNGGDFLETNENVEPRAYIVKEAMKAFSMSNLTDQLEICSLIASIVHNKSDVIKSNDNELLCNFWKGFNSTYAVIKKNEVIEYEMFQSLKHELEDIKQNLDYVKEENVRLLTENNKLNTTKTTMLEGISSFLEGQEQERIHSRERIYTLQKERDAIGEENRNFKDTIESCNKEREKLYQDNLNITIEYKTKLAKIAENIKLLEEERDYLKAELQNWTKNMDSLTSKDRPLSDPRFVLPPGMSQLQNPLLGPSAQHNPYAGFPRDPLMSTYSSGYISKLPLLPTPPSTPLQRHPLYNSSAYGVSLRMPESSISRSLLDVNNPPSVIQPPAKSVLKQLDEIDDFIGSNNLTKQANLQHENASAKVSADSSTSNLPSPFKHASIGIASSSAGMQLNLSSVYPTNRPLSAGSSSYASAVNRQSSDDDFGKFWKIIQLIQHEFPLLKHDDFVFYLYKIRRDNGNKLSRMKLRDIIAKLKNEITNRKADKAIVPKPPVNGSSSLGLGSFLEASCAWRNVHQDLLFDSESEYAGDICAICHETMTDNLHRLRCGHVHHLKCLEDWYKLQSTCPICREHCPLTCDYPPLK